MSKFTKGQWYYEEYIPEGVTLNGKEYLIQSESKEDVALVRTEADARLIAHAPELYSMLSMLAKIAEKLSLEKEAMHISIPESAFRLLSVIDNGPAESMKYPSSFFQNKECEYFPCHEIRDTDDFSCLFCFCPLYSMENCPGKPRWKANGVKDCSGCTLPHISCETIIRMVKEAEHEPS